MAWETRERGGRYYTRSRREGGRVVREYVSTGPFAKRVAEADRAAREEREAAAMHEGFERERVEALAAPVLELSEVADILTRAHLIAAGCHQHKGEWRRRRSGDA